MTRNTEFHVSLTLEWSRKVHLLLCGHALRKFSSATSNLFVTACILTAWGHSTTVLTNFHRFRILNKVVQAQNWSDLFFLIWHWQHFSVKNRLNFHFSYSRASTYSSALPYYHDQEYRVSSFSNTWMIKKVASKTGFWPARGGDRRQFYVLLKSTFQLHFHDGVFWGICL